VRRIVLPPNHEESPMNPCKTLGIAVVVSLSFTAALLAAPPVNTYGEGGGWFSDPKRTDTAIRGYDPVAYFTDGKPVPGKDAYRHEWMGAKWKFATQAHLDLFKADPAKYAPQFGGYCAYGVASGYLVKIEPDQWSIVDGKLYLNYDAGVSAKWQQDRAEFIRKADATFGTLLAK
jgi:YHS domain-containing protein